MSLSIGTANQPYPKVVAIDGVNGLVAFINTQGIAKAKLNLSTAYTISTNSADEKLQIKMLLDVVNTIGDLGNNNKNAIAVEAKFQALYNQGLLDIKKYFQTAPAPVAAIISYTAPTPTNTGISKWVYIGVGSALLIGASLFVYFKFIKK